MCVGVHKNKQTCKEFRNFPMSFATTFLKNENSVLGRRKDKKGIFMNFFPTMKAI